MGLNSLKMRAPPGALIFKARLEQAKGVKKRARQLLRHTYLTFAGLLRRPRLDLSPMSSTVFRKAPKFS